MQPSNGPSDPRDHFTVKLQTRATKDNPHLFTVDPTFGDGLLSRWPQESEDMTLLKPEHEKHVLWRRTAGDHLAKELEVWNGELTAALALPELLEADMSSRAALRNPDRDAQFWILDVLPMNYALFEQVTHPKPEKPGAVAKPSANKIRLDRFVFGE